MYRYAQGNASNEGVVVLPSGLQYKILETGKGGAVQVGSPCLVVDKRLVSTLQLQSENPVSKFAFEFNLYRYRKGRLASKLTRRAAATTRAR